MTIVAAMGVQKRFDRIIDCSGTPCSLRTLTACTTVFPVLMMGSKKVKLKFSGTSQNKQMTSYTSTALAVLIHRQEIEHRRPSQRMCQRRFQREFFRF